MSVTLLEVRNVYFTLIQGRGFVWPRARTLIPWCWASEVCCSLRGCTASEWVAQMASQSDQRSCRSPESETVDTHQFLKHQLWASPKIKHGSCEWRFFISYKNRTTISYKNPHLAWVVRTDGDAKISLDESVVDQMSHVLECLPIVFTDTVTKLYLEPQLSYSMCDIRDN